VVFRYTTADGRLDDAANVNGSSRAIAGVCNERRNVVGLMPHPERASEAELGSADGQLLIAALTRSLAPA
jgi:phosphoribosylformylglycinamidine (FGAM) synthase-like amidotransferase family enzyme